MTLGGRQQERPQPCRRQPKQHPFAVAGAPATNIAINTDMKPGAMPTR